MALGCPVRDIGPLPGRQIAPVARCRLQIALVFQVPCVLWFSPIVQQDIHSCASAIIVAAVRMSASVRPVMPATTSGGYPARKPGIGSQPSVCSAMKSASMSPLSTSRWSIPLSSARSVPGLIGRYRSARSAVVVRRGIDHDQLGPCLEPVDHAQVEDRMTVGHVGADHEEQVGPVEVGVRARRSVGAERLLVARPGAGHAQPRVGLDVHGPDEALGQLGGQVLRLHRHLAGYVERDGVGAVLVEDGPQSTSRCDRGIVDVHGCQFTVARRPHQCRGEAPLVGAHHLGVGGALGAQPAEVAGVQPVSRHARNGRQPRRGVGAGLHRDSATDPAVRACRPRRRGRHLSAGSGARPTCSPGTVPADCMRRKTIQVTTAQIT